MDDHPRCYGPLTRSINLDDGEDSRFLSLLYLTLLFPCPLSHSLSHNFLFPHFLFTLSLINFFFYFLSLLIFSFVILSIYFPSPCFYHFLCFPLYLHFLSSPLISSVSLSFTISFISLHFFSFLYYLIHLCPL